MKKIFVFLLSAVLLFEQAVPSKVNAEPTELCRNLISYLSYDCDRLKRGNNFDRFSLEQLQDELNNYDENDFDEENRSFANEAIRSYREALDVLVEAVSRDLPDEVNERIHIGEKSENPEIWNEQHQAVIQYLFENISDQTNNIITTGSVRNETFFSMDLDIFRAENKEVFIRYLSILFKHDTENVFNSSPFIVIFLARALFRGYDECRFFRIYTYENDFDEVDYKVIHAELLSYNGKEVIHIDDFLTAI